MRAFLKAVASILPPLTKERIKAKLAEFKAPGKWEEIEERILHLFIQRHRISIDVGANTGSYTVLLALLTKHVIAFEPHESAAKEILARRLPNVDVRIKAVSDHEGTAVLATPERQGALEIAMATIVSDEHISGTCRYIKVETTTLDQFSNQDIGFVKIDVEGHELSVLNGARHLINHQKPIFLVEAQGYSRKDAVRALFDFFRSNNYHGWFIFENKTHDLDQFSSDMANHEELIRDVPRVNMKYTNNFLFFPNIELANLARRKVDKYLSRRFY